MATSGYKVVAATSQNNLRFEWEIVSQDIVKNTTTIAWTLKLTSGSWGEIISSAAKYSRVYVDGTQTERNVYIDIGANTSKVLQSGTETLYHNTDGTKTFSYNFSQDFNITFNGASIGTISGSGTGEVNAIPRVSTTTTPTLTIGEKSTITINRKNSSLRDTITAVYGTNTYTIATKTAETKVDWTVSTDLYQRMTQQAIGQIQIQCSSYSGTTLIGTNTETVQLQVDKTINKPDILASVKDINAATISVTGDDNILVKYKSNAQCTISVTTKNYATLKSKYIINGRVSRNNVDAFTFEAIENNRFSFGAKDSRTLETEVVITPTIIDYIIPTCNMSVKQPTPAAEGEATTTLTISGVMFNGSFGRATNTKIIEYRYKADDGEYTQWAAANATHTNNNYTSTVDIGGLDYTKAYTFQSRARDNLHITESIEYTVRTTPIFDWSENDFNFNVPVKINNIEVDYIVEQGDSGLWKYRKWNSGTAELWRRSDARETTTETPWGSMYCTDSVFNPVQYPFPFVEAPTVTVTPQTTQGNFWLFTGGGGTAYVSPAYGVIRPNISTVKAICNYYVIGRWKE